MKAIKSKVLTKSTVAKRVMGMAWNMRRTFAKKHNVKVSEIHFGECLKMAWNLWKKQGEQKVTLDALTTKGKEWFGGDNHRFYFESPARHHKFYYDVDSKQFVLELAAFAKNHKRKNSYKKEAERVNFDKVVKELISELN